MTREEFYKLTDILNSEVLGSFMHGGEADELIAMFEEAVDHSNILEQEKPISEDFLSLVDKEARELWKEINSGNDFSIVDSFNQFYGICIQVAESTVEWQKNLQEPVSNALEEELDKYIKDNFTIDKEQLDKFGIEEKDYMYSMDKSDMLKMIRHFTNNYKVPISDVLEEAAKLCVSDYFCITNEEDWDEHAVNALNIFKIAAQWQKEQMIKDSVDAECDVILLEEGDELQYSVLYPKGKKPFNKGDLAKLIIIKED